MLSSIVNSPCHRILGYVARPYDDAVAAYDGHVAAYDGYATAHDGSTTSNKDTNINYYHGATDDATATYDDVVASHGPTTPQPIYLTLLRGVANFIKRCS